MKLPSQQSKASIARFFNIAIESAIDGVNLNHGGPFGAVITKDGAIIAKAHNEVVRTNDPTMHAEINAIRKACKKLSTFDLSDCIIYTTCMPCPMCFGAIMWSNIRVVYYGATSQDADEIGFRDDKFYNEIGLKTNGEFELINSHRQECLAPFKLWQNKHDKKQY